MLHDKSKRPLLWKISKDFYSPFYLNKHVRREGYTCGSAYFGHIFMKYKNLQSDMCSQKKCTGCEIHQSHENTVKLKLRGLCKYSAFDKTYQVHYNPNTQIYYKGTGKSVISFNFVKDYWVLKNINNPNVTAISYIPFKTLAIGNYAWNITGDIKCKDKTRMLSLTSCNDEKFTCNSGLCINVTQRCDGKVDCNDDSDELHCEVVKIDESYNNLLAPPPHEEKKTKKISVNISIEIQTFSAFSPIEGSFESQFTLAMVWYDSRLKYNNLRDSPKSLRMETIEEIWFPGLKFENTKTKVMIEPDINALVQVTRKGNGTHCEEDEVENKLMYSGNDNPLSFERFYSLIFQCTYDLQLYPFDKQYCTIEITLYTDMADFVRMEVGNFSYTGNKDLRDYTIKDTSMLNNKDGNKLHVSVIIDRRLISLILTTYYQPLSLTLLATCLTTSMNIILKSTCL